MNSSRIIICILILTVTILRLLFSVMRTRLNNYSLLFELVYLLCILISVIKISQYVSLYMAGDLSSGDFGMSFSLEMGTYALNLISMVTYFIRYNLAKLTNGMYDKCEACNGDLYAYGPPNIINNRHICGACTQTINENKEGQIEGSGKLEGRDKQN